MKRRGFLKTLLYTPAALHSGNVIGRFVVDEQTEVIEAPPEIKYNTMQVFCQDIDEQTRVTIDVSGLRTIFVHIDTDAPLTGFDIETSVGSTYSLLYSSETDYLQPWGFLLGTSGDLSSLNGEGWFAMDVLALSTIRLTPKGKGDVSISWNEEMI